MSKSQHTVTVLGLGPGNLNLLTLEAAERLAATDRIYVRTRRHPTVDQLSSKFPRLLIDSFDNLYETRTTFEDVYGAIVSRILEIAREDDVIYCVPGSPTMAEGTVHLIQEMATAAGIAICLIQGVSFVEVTLSAIREYDTEWLSIFDAAEIDLMAHQNALGEISGIPGIIPVRTPIITAPMMVSQLYSTQIASSVKLWLSRYWPEDHIVCLVLGAGTSDERVEKIPLHQLDRIPIDHLTTLFVPGLKDAGDGRTFDSLLNVTRALRAPGGCPWDREQTHDSLKGHLIEETYEVVEALDEHDYVKLSEELGDLLFQVTIHSQVAAEHDEFDIGDVIEGITRKLIRRHPHVFGDMELATSAAVLERWESFKDAEKPERASVLDGIPVAMPALPYSHAVQKRAAHQGFDWPDISSLLDKADEELSELRKELVSEAGGGGPGILEELGDLLFVLVSFARKQRIDPEEALRRANRKFVRRFQHAETSCRSQGKRLSELQPSEIDSLWQAAKAAR